MRRTPQRHAPGEHHGGAAERPDAGTEPSAERFRHRRPALRRARRADRLLPPPLPRLDRRRLRCHVAADGTRRLRARKQRLVILLTREADNCARRACHRRAERVRYAPLRPESRVRVRGGRVSRGPRVRANRVMPKTIETTPQAVLPIIASDAALAPLPWVRSWMGDSASSSTTRDRDADIDITITCGDELSFVTAIAPKARVSDGNAFHQRSAAVYRAIRTAFDNSPHRHVVRMWNHIPGIHDPLDAECDRYMHFNAGRFEAMCEWFGGAGSFPQRVPAASGVGHDGQDLIVHALAMREPGTPVENPQQVPAFRYSKRYGPLPPCFARATQIARPAPSLLIAGTAAITGEVSRHL